MSLLPPPLGTPVPTPAAPLAGAGAPAPQGARPAGAAGFASVWAQVAPGGAGSQVRVQSGDTLIGLVKAHYRLQSLPIDEAQAFRLAHQVAADNGIANPNLIYPDQQIDFARLNLPALARAPAGTTDPLASTEQALAQRLWSTPSPVPRQLSTQPLTADAAETPGETPVLDRTLARAVDNALVRWSMERELRERDAALARSEAFARGVLNSLPQHVLVLDDEGVVRAVNESWERFAGTAPGPLARLQPGANYLAACEAAARLGDAVEQGLGARVFLGEVFPQLGLHLLAHRGAVGGRHGEEGHAFAFELFHSRETLVV